MKPNDVAVNLIPGLAQNNAVKLSSKLSTFSRAPSRNWRVGYYYVSLLCFPRNGFQSGGSYAYPVYSSPYNSYSSYHYYRRRYYNGYGYTTPYPVHQYYQQHNQSSEVFPYFLNETNMPPQNETFEDYEDYNSRNISLQDEARFTDLVPDGNVTDEE